LLALGGNIGDREAALRRALELLLPVVSLRRVSSLYETAPVGLLAQGPFLNAVVAGETTLAPRQLLAYVKDVERRLGRTPTVRNGPRIVDLDILGYDDVVMDDPDLQIPHLRLAERAFVLVPLAEVAPRWRHPRTGRTAEELLGHLGEVRGVIAFKEQWAPVAPSQRPGRSGGGT
jgi:2-amino-4-hydroxy-6-hydroxymethyldihydropteridine diphosphokinase